LYKYTLSFSRNLVQQPIGESAMNNSTYAALQAKLGDGTVSIRFIRKQFLSTKDLILVFVDARRRCTLPPSVGPSNLHIPHIITPHLMLLQSSHSMVQIVHISAKTVQLFHFKIDTFCVFFIIYNYFFIICFYGKY
jgi:hypothetical protein